MQLISTVFLALAWSASGVKAWNNTTAIQPSPSFTQTDRGSSAIKPSSTESVVQSEPSGNPKDNTAIIAGGIAGGILFVTLVVVILLLAQRRILKNQHETAVRELHAIHFTNNRLRRTRGESQVQKPTPVQPEAASFPETADVPEMTLPYVMVLEDWEIAPDNLKLLDKKLGEGQFGIVRKGLLTTKNGDSEVVAVKTLKDGAKTSDLEDLKMELIILKQTNKIPHPNVVRFVGSCSIKGKMHILTEFCSGGSLRNLLIDSRVYSSPSYTNMVSTLDHNQLLKFAVDVANGMAHLSSQKLVHRDLAARNVLIGDENYTAKISDFGLARDVEGIGEYTRNNHNLLPLKWMALESLSHDHFTTASDVWGYGILLHEITTLGEEPYKNAPPHQVVAQVGCGYRMPQPPECSNELYEIMTRCWKAEPKERPTFAEIYEQLHNMLMDDKKSYINIAQILDDGKLTTIPESKNLSFKDKSINVNLKKM